MKMHRNKNHPRKIITHSDGDIEYRKHSICAKLGNISCFQKNRKSDLAVYGAGVVAYFQFLKYLIWQFLVMSVLAAPSMCFYFSGNDSTVKDFKSLLVQFSLGNIGGEDSSCNTGSYITTSSVGATTDYKGEVYLQCAFGKLNSMQAFGQVSVNDNVNCNAVITAESISDQVVFYPSTCESGQWTSGEMAILQNTFEQDCQGKANCRFEFAQS